MKNGTMREENANAAPNSRCQCSVSTSLRNANPDPRSTIPNAASHSGSAAAVMTAANAAGNAVQKMTRMKISHTWLASQTGVIVSSISCRGARPRWSPPASRSHSPPPKSAPPSAAYKVSPVSKIPPTTSVIMPGRRVASGAPASAR